MKSSKRYQRLVVKVGSSILTCGGISIVPERLSRIVCHVVSLIEKGHDIILVTSGAIASGLSVLGFKKRPTALSELQAAAAVGQNILMQAYNAELKKFKLKGAQILLTREDFGDRQRYLNARNTINTLLKHKIIPIINENDAISVEEIKFGDNDTLSARVAAAVEADGFVLLTDIDGLYQDFDSKTRTGTLIQTVEEITPEIKKTACGTDKSLCIGGMFTKIKAIEIAKEMGIPSICASGINKDLHIDFDPSSMHDGTLFPAKKAIGSKKHWIAFEAKTLGSIVVDDGAKKALVTTPASLLAQGIIDTTGEFSEKDVVDITDTDYSVIARGITGYSSQAIQKIKGKKAGREVVHRDNLVLLI